MSSSFTSLKTIALVSSSILQTLLTGFVAFPVAFVAHAIAVLCVGLSDGFGARTAPLPRPSCRPCGASTPP